MNTLLLGIIIGSFWQIVALWLYFAFRKSLPEAIRAYFRAWKNAIKNTN